MQLQLNDPCKRVSLLPEVPLLKLILKHVSEKVKDAIDPRQSTKLEVHDCVQNVLNDEI